MSRMRKARMPSSILDGREEAIADLEDAQGRDAADPLIAGLLRDRVALTANARAGLAGLAILVLMVWRPS